jgi:hypothetical protein
MFQVHSPAHDTITPSQAEALLAELDDAQLAAVGGGNMLPVGGWAPPDASAIPVGGW